MNAGKNRLTVILSTVAGVALLLAAFLVVWLVPREAGVTGATGGSGGGGSVASTGRTGGSQLNNVNAQEGKVDGTSAGLGVSDQPRISVRGSGVVSAKPDMANLQVGVSIQDPSLETAQSEAAGKMEALVQQLMAAGIDEKDINTTQYNVEPVMDYRDGQSPTVTGFRVTNVVEVKIRDLSKASKLIDDLVKSGANTIYGLSFGFSDPSALMKQAREAAVKDAREKAEQLAGLNGVALGAVLVVDDGGANVPPPAIEAKVANMAAQDAALPPINPGQQEVRVEVSVVYGIK
ncbi:MAG TPA: SIMPL domain-containing protein [Chloroflexia bacterium]